MKAFRTYVIGLAAVSLGVLVPGSLASAVETERHDHWKAVERVCQTWLTFEVIRGHEEFVAEWDRGATATTEAARKLSGAVTFARHEPMDIAYAKCNQAR